MDKLAIIKETFDANLITGEVFWKTRPRLQFSSEAFWLRNCRESAGKKVKCFAVNRQGHRAVSFRAYGRRVRILLHHVVWVLAKGFLPTLDIDHVNNDPADNRLVNLRLASRAQNSTNKTRKLPGLKGAYKLKTGQWQSTLWVGNKHIYLGHFSSEQAAHEAWVEAAVKHHGAYFNPGYSSVFD